MIIPATYRFSAHCSKQFVCFIIIHKIQSHNCDTGWGLYHISMVFISIPFKHKKAWLLHLLTSSFLQGVYPVGMTEFLPYFMQIISNNSVNVHQIPTTLGTEICFNELFKCAKFQPDWIVHWCYDGFVNCVK